MEESETGTEVPLRERFAVSEPIAAKLLSVSQKSVSRLVAKNELILLKVGTRRLIQMESLERWAAGDAEKSATKRVEPSAEVLKSARRWRKGAK